MKKLITAVLLVSSFQASANTGSTMSSYLGSLDSCKALTGIGLSAMSARQAGLPKELIEEDLKHVLVKDADTTRAIETLTDEVASYTVMPDVELQEHAVINFGNKVMKRCLDSAVKRIILGD